MPKLIIVMNLKSYIARLAISLGACVSLFAASACTPNGQTDFAHYNVPLRDQVSNRVKEKVLVRLGEGKNSRDRYFIVPFAYQNKGNAPGYSHTFISVIRVLGDEKQLDLTPGLRERTYKNRSFEAFTISWLPKDFKEDPNLCVFKGFGSRLVPSLNRCPMVPGKVFNLDETIQLAANVKNVVCMWGPYEIRKEAFDLGVKRLRLLEGGSIKYKADDRLSRKDRSAINCFHAAASLYDFYPNGGIFGTGFKMWGINGTSRVLMEYTDKANTKGLLLEPVDVKADQFGFVYAPTRDSRGVYNPFKKAFAYHE